MIKMKYSIKFNNSNELKG